MTIKTQKIRTGVVGYTRCVSCGVKIAETVQYDDGHAYTYEVNEYDNRFIDKWGNHRNVCVNCIR